MASHLLVHTSFVHVVLLFPAASLMIHRACSEKGCRYRRRFRPGAVVVTMGCSVCWSSASARRASARLCLFRRVSGGRYPSDDWQHGSWCRSDAPGLLLLFSAASSRCVGTAAPHWRTILGKSRCDSRFLKNVKVCSQFCAGQS